MKIIAWPPVGIVSRAPWVDRPVVRSEGLNIGTRAVATAGPSRRTVQLSVSSLACGRAGAGYMAELWRQIDGGVNLVRADLVSPNWVTDLHVGRQLGYTRPGAWISGGDIADWTSDGDTAVWFTGAKRPGTPGTDALGYDTITVAGLPASTVIVRPGDILRSFALDAGAVTGSAHARAVAVARSDAAGVVTIRLDGPLPAGIISLHDAESVVFEVVSIQTTAQSVGTDWQTAVGLREVLAHEYSGATEHDPW